MKGQSDLRSASGKAFTQPYERRTTANWVDFLSEVEALIAPVGGAALMLGWGALAVLAMRRR